MVIITGLVIGAILGVILFGVGFIVEEGDLLQTATFVQDHVALLEVMWVIIMLLIAFKHGRGRR